jgi:hypothetical protein
MKRYGISEHMEVVTFVLILVNPPLFEVETVPKQKVMQR